MLMLNLLNEINTWLATLSVLGVVVTFAWGVFQYIRNEKRQTENRRIEATKPFLERQLKLYTEATQAVATIATSDDATEKESALKRFWALFWGELALVEDSNVEAAMVQLGKGLESNSSREELQQLSLQLAHACRDSLAVSWGVKQWQSHYHSHTNE